MWNKKIVAATGDPILRDDNTLIGQFRNTCHVGNFHPPADARKARANDRMEAVRTFIVSKFPGEEQ